MSLRLVSEHPILWLILPEELEMEEVLNLLSLDLKLKKLLWWRQPSKDDLCRWQLDLSDDVLNDAFGLLEGLRPWGCDGIRRQLNSWWVVLMEPALLVSKLSMLSTIRCCDEWDDLSKKVGVYKAIFGEGLAWVVVD